MINRRKYLVIMLLLVLISFFLVGNVSAQEGQETLYCAEKTIDGARCLNVPLEEVNMGFRNDRTSCESTSYCSEGTCVNTRTGECLPSPEATCNPSQGGYFYNQPKDEVAQCSIGCCLLGDEAKFVERVACDVLGSDYNVKATFRADIQDEPSCQALASPQEEGACIFEMEIGRDCSHDTRENCQINGGEFHPGLLCTAPQLGTLCSMTTNTRCEPGKNDVYYVDGCGNTANVYDATKIKDVNYWSYRAGNRDVKVDEGNGQGNKGSATNGFCDVGEGSTCKGYERGVDPNVPKYGDSICRKTDCVASSLTGDVARANGDEWCSASINTFENAKPGEISYAMYCANGEVKYELCDSFRNKLCSEDGNGGARCVVNRWGDCMLKNSTADCLNEDERDCEVVRDAGVLRTQYGVEKEMWDDDAEEYIIAACVPKYSPGFKFWDPTGTIAESENNEDVVSICSFASVTCTVPYTQEIVGFTDFRAGASAECVKVCQSAEGWSESKCYQSCTPRCLDKTLNDKKEKTKINQDWAEGYQNLCVSLGDCGVIGDYKGGEGYNSWKDLFKGEKIDWTTLPGVNDKK
ncbi:MAG: hypothetical protein KKB79_02005 [Nanoarchaeota archaeon]|nr:hypothetical protein [Nanoarchaeota archaeon]